MARLIITLRIMPEGLEQSLDEIKLKAEEIIKSNDGVVNKTVYSPIAFGLKSIDLTFNITEKEGGTEVIEQAIRDINGVDNTEVINISRALG